MIKSAMRALQTPSFTLTQTVPVAGEGRLRLLAAAPGCDWGRRGAESAVATILLSGAPVAELVLHRGETLAEYTVALGPLAVGSPQISVVFRPDLSPRGAQGIHIEDAWVETIPKEHPDYLLWRYAPRLYGRPENAASDTPLLLLARYAHEGAFTRLAYAYVWSDQDSDRGVVKRMAQDGTPTDIDWVYELSVNRRTGQPTRAVVQGAGELTTPLWSRLAAGHPVLATSTTNNMVSPKGHSSLLFSLPPVWAYDETRGPRERALDAFPWALELTAKEVQREGRLAYEVFDPRNYLYADFHASLPSGGLVALQVRLKNGTVFTSDRNSTGLSAFRSGWVRTAVALPVGVTAMHLAQARFIRRDSLSAPHQIRSATLFQLDAKYQPKPITIPIAS